MSAPSATGMSWKRVFALVMAAALAAATAVRAAAAELAAPAPAGQGLANPVAALSLDALTATRERPLFSPSRRPPPAPVAVRPAQPAPAPAPPAPPPQPTVALFGTVLGLNRPRALIRSGGAADITEVGVGDQVDGWTVDQIDRRRLVLSLGERSATFELFTSAATPAPPHHQRNRVLEYNAAGVLRSRRISRSGP